MIMKISIGISLFFHLLKAVHFLCGISYVGVSSMAVKHVSHSHALGPHLFTGQNQNLVYSTKL